MTRTFVALVLLSSAFSSSLACVTPRIDKPSHPIASGDDAGVQFTPRDTTVTAFGFEQDVASQSYVVNSLNRAADGSATDAAAKTTVVLAPAEGEPPPNMVSVSKFKATITTEVGDTKVTTSEEAPVGNQPLKLIGFGGYLCGSVMGAVATAIIPFNVGAIPLIALGSCGLASLGVAAGGQALSAQAEQADASDLLARTMTKHGKDLHSRRGEIGPRLKDLDDHRDDHGDDHRDDDDDDAAAPPAVASSKAPSPREATPPPPGDTWFAGIDGKPVQLSSVDLQKAIEEGRVASISLVWKPGMPMWAPARDVRELDALFKHNGWYAAINGKVAGPLSRSSLQREIDRKGIASSTLVWRAGMKDWVRADGVDELRALLQR